MAGEAVARFGGARVACGIDVKEGKAAVRGWTDAETAVAAPPLLRGEDVMARYALPPGPVVGHLLARAREAQDLGLVRTRDEALAYLDSSDGAP